MTFDGTPQKPPKARKSSLKIIAIVVIAVAFLIFGVFKFVGKLDGFLRSTYAYTESIRLLHENKAATAILGSPIEIGEIISGNVQLNNLDGSATYTIAVKGSTCEGVYYIRSDKTLGTWDIYLLTLQSDCAEAPLVLRNTRNILFLGESATEA